LKRSNSTDFTTVSNRNEPSVSEEFDINDWFDNRIITNENSKSLLQFQFANSILKGRKDELCRLEDIPDSCHLFLIKLDKSKATVPPRGTFIALNLIEPTEEKIW
jgi:hypothetical protein